MSRLRANIRPPMIRAWTRYWTKPDGQVSLADQGFLVGPAETEVLGFESLDLWSFDQIAEHPV